jgi:hypothetical protein
MENISNPAVFFIHFLWKILGETALQSRGSGGNGATSRENSIFMFPGHCLQRINAKSYRAINRQDNTQSVALGGVVVSVLATGPMVAGSNPAEDDGF